MSLSSLLLRARPEVEKNIIAQPAPLPAFTLFVSLSDTRARARVVHAAGASLDEVWREVAAQCQRLVTREKLDVRWLRVDWITSARKSDWKSFRTRLKAFKRNYFRYGLALDQTFRIAFLEQELNGNAMLYGGTHVEHALLNEKNFSIYARTRFKDFTPNFSDDQAVWALATQGIFCSVDSPVRLLHASGPDAGRRIIDTLDVATVDGLIQDSSRYLSTQVRKSGQFHYGWHPCFDRPIPTYNSLRHASTTYSMLEAWEVTGDPALKAAILRALAYLTTHLIKAVRLASGEMAAFLIDHPNEIKLGGNAVCLLALTKYSELFASNEYRQLLEQLALGIRFMQNPDTGKFVHVLNYPDLSIKQDFRIIYYDGEAAFGLMRLYKLTRDPRWLGMVEKAFEQFIALEHWKAHDHWLSYCVNELTLYRPEARFYEFGIRNVAGYLDFVKTRITTFPTLLELMMAAELMLVRLRADAENSHLLAGLDVDKFYLALEFRARHLLNGHFWPEQAMYFRNPQRIAGSFFIRHHAFRVRIDDVEHYLSGYVAYRKFLLRGQAEFARQPHLPAANQAASAARVDLG